jgi:hypothetical protein
MAFSYSHLFGFPTTGLRFFTVYGPWGRPDMAYFSFTNAILRGHAIPVFNEGRMIRDFTYVDDIVEGVVRVIDRPPRPVSVGIRFAPNPRDPANIDAIRAKVNALTAPQVAALTSTAIEALTTTQQAGLASSQIAALTTTQVAALSTTGVVALTTTQVAGLTTTQIDNLFTVAQRHRALTIWYLHGIHPTASGDTTPTMWAYWLSKIDEAVAAGWLEVTTMSNLFRRMGGRFISAQGRRAIQWTDQTGTLRTQLLP